MKDFTEAMTESPRYAASHPAAAAHQGVTEHTKIEAKVRRDLTVRPGRRR
ncbi:hypothetical protein ABZY09_31415 [Streptomyces sp. NPDC002928]